MKKLLFSAIVVCLMAGPAMSQDPFQPGKEKGKEISQETKDLMKKHFEKDKEASEKNRERIKELFNRQKEIVTAEEFDKNSYLENSKEIRELIAKSAERRAVLMSEIFSQLSQEERKAMMEKRPDRGPKGKKDGRGPKGKRPDNRRDDNPAMGNE